MTKTTQTHWREKRATKAHTWVAKQCATLVGLTRQTHWWGAWHRRRKELPHSWNSFAKDLVGRMASGGVREVSRFLTRMATWFSCVDGDRDWFSEPCQTSQASARKRSIAVRPCPPPPPGQSQCMRATCSYLSKPVRDQHCSNLFARFLWFRRQHTFQTGPNTFTIWDPSC